MSVEENFRTVEDRIAAACQRAGRDPAEVLIVVVTKTVDAAFVRDKLLPLGVRDIGENRVSQAAEKAEQLAAAPDIHLHMIGHLQRRKARKAVELCSMIHSIDSLRLAERVSDAAAEQGKEMPVLLEVNVSGEESKYGFSPDEAREAAPHVAALPGIRLDGLMTMAPFGADESVLRSVFAGLRDLAADISAQHNIPLPHLSMGMSQGYEIAIEEGATIVRIGTAIVG